MLLRLIIAFFTIFAVLDLSLLTMYTNCSFYIYRCNKSLSLTSRMSRDSVFDLAIRRTVYRRTFSTLPISTGLAAPTTRLRLISLPLHRVVPVITWLSRQLYDLFGPSLIRVGSRETTAQQRSVKNKALVYGRLHPGRHSHGQWTRLVCSVQSTVDSVGVCLSICLFRTSHLLQGCSATCTSLVCRVTVFELFELCVYVHDKTGCATGCVV